MDSKPSSRASPTSSCTISKLCTRCTACWTSGSKSCTPKLTRLKPMPARLRSRSRLAVRGSTSMDSSAPGSTRNERLSSPISEPSSSSERKVGEPPPRCSCDTGWLLPSSATCISTSRSIQYRYSAPRLLCFVMILLQAQ